MMEIPKDKLDKMKLAYQAGCSDGEAWAFAGISGADWVQYRKENPTVESWKEEDKLPAALAKIAILKKIKRASQDEDGDPKSDAATVQWYLERKDPTFRAKQDVTSGGNPIEVNLLAAINKIYGEKSEGGESDK